MCLNLLDICANGGVVSARRFQKVTLPTQDFPTNTERQPMKVANIGVIGFGSIGSRVGRELQVATGGLAKVAAVVEPQDEKFAEGCKFIGYEPAKCADIHELLGRGLDGVFIASPNNCHLENLEELRGNDIPVLLEKPLDSSFEKICDVLRFAEAYNGPIVVDHVMRYAPIIATAKELLGSGVIGELCSASFVQNCFYGNDMYHNFRRTMAGSGGMFIEKATHDFDIMMYLLACKPIKVGAVAKRQAYGGDKPNDLHCRECGERLTCKESANNISYRSGAAGLRGLEASNDLCVYAGVVDVPDNEVAMVEFEKGLFGTYAQCFFSPPSYSTREYELIGLGGTMKISFSLVGDHNKGRILICPRYGTPEDVITYDFDYRGRIHYNGGGAVAKHFCRVIDGKEAPFTTVRQAFLAEVLGNAATLAAQEGEFVSPERLLPDDLKDLWSQL